MKILILCIFLSGCVQTQVSRQHCIHKCVVKVLTVLSLSGYSNISVDAIMEARRVCEKKLEGISCYSLEGEYVLEKWRTP